MRDLLNWEILKSDNYVVLDFETDTSGGQYGAAPQPENRLLLACWKLGPDHPRALHYPHFPVLARWGGEYEQTELLDDIASADFVIAHSAKYEAGWLLRMGLKVEEQVWFCTRLAEYVLLGNRAAGGEGLAPVRISLDACVRRRGGTQKDPVVDILIKNGVNPVRIPRKWLQGRCMKDVADTESLFLSQRDELVSSNRLPVLWTRSIISPVLAEIEATGMHVDKARVEATHAEYTQRLVDLDLQMDHLTGGINTRSSKQVAEFVYGTLGFKEKTDKSGKPKRTATGAPLTSQKVLDTLVATNQKQRSFISLRKERSKIASALSKALDFLLGVARERDGKFLGQFNQANTATHRLSSSGVPISFADGETRTTQFQNLPRAFKPLFGPGEMM
jgi:DNA polymerase I-like protein with 3'-5' exonuclease and polymerase domains